MLKTNTKTKIWEKKNRGRDDEMQRSAEMSRRRNDRTNEGNDENNNDVICEHAKENVVRISENKNKKIRNHRWN